MDPAQSESENVSEKEGFSYLMRRSQPLCYQVFLALVLVLVLVVRAGSALGQSTDDAARRLVIVLAGGTRMEVRDYQLQGGLVLLTTLDGKLRSIARPLVDLEATERERLRERAHGSVTGSAESFPSSGCSGDGCDGNDSNATTPDEDGESPHAPSALPPTPIARGMGDEGEGEVEGEGEGETVFIYGPSPPAPPETVSRDGNGLATVRAVRIEEPVILDGKLEESIYRIVPSIGGFIQQEPHEGEPATEETEVWLLYDHDNIYVSARCWDSHPERIIANEMRRDGINITLNDHFAVILDTFYDRRNGFYFYTNPLGGRVDGQITDESNANRDWNPIWDVKTGRFAEGWTVEMAIPFKSLRYREGGVPIWGLNFRRVIPSKNETSYLTQVPASFGRRGGMKLSSAGTVVGIEPPARTLNLEVKPYVTGGSRSDLAAAEPFSNELDSDAGFDVKYGVTRSLVFDFTYNTDFAQVEDDEQRVNLTRFSLFFPEKREFFLEGQGIFAFGGRGTSRFEGAANNTPIMFFSRRIGLSDATEVPIRAGGRLTGRAGAYTLGALAIQTDELPAASVPTTNFSVVRVKRDILRRSNVGVIATHRSASVTGNGTGSNALFGFDTNLSFYDNLDINAYYSRTRTPLLEGEDASYLGRLDYGSDRYGLQLERLVVGENFNPEIGFLRRADFRRSYAQFRFSPRPASLPAVRKFSYEAGIDYFTEAGGEHRLETREVELAFRTELASGDSLDATYTRSFEFLEDPFTIADGVVLPVGGYGFQWLQYGYRLGPQRRITGRLNFQHGGFFSGDRIEVGYTGRIELTPRLSLEPGLTFNWVDLPEGRFTTRLARARVSFTFSPRMDFGALVQYNSANSSLSSNLRFRWEYLPGSDLFVVYNDLRDPMSLRYPGVESRSFVIKFTRLFRF